MVQSMNYTFIALIPKVKSPTLVSEYKPISMCNVIYKIIAKTLANKVKGVLPAIISQQQSALIPERLISDNILVAYEVLHPMKNRQR